MRKQLPDSQCPANIPAHHQASIAARDADCTGPRTKSDYDIHRMPESIHHRQCHNPPVLHIKRFH